MMRAGKRTVQRGNTIKLYSQGINALYESNKATAEGISPSQIEFADQSTLRPSLRKFMVGEIGLSGTGDDDDFFVAGLDSLQVANSARRINAAVESQELRNFQLTSKDIYAISSVATLTSEIMSMIQHSGE